MAQFTTDIPDDLNQRVRSNVQSNGEDLSSFTARAFHQLLSTDEDPILEAELARKTRRGLEELDAGRVVELRQAVRDIASEKNIHFPR